MLGSPRVLKFRESGAAPCRGDGSALKVKPLRVMWLVTCDPVDSACNGEFIGENAMCTETSHCRLSKEVSCEMMLCSLTVSNLFQGTAIDVLLD